MNAVKVILLFFLIAFSHSCNEEINFDNIHLKNGLYINDRNGEILDGHYKSVTPVNGNFQKTDVILLEYSDGIPVGNWSDTYNGDLIHSGTYLEETAIKSKIQQLTNSKRVDLNLWEESDEPSLTIELIEPRVTDSLTLKKVINCTNNFDKSYKFNQIYVDSIVTTNKNYIYEVESKMP